MDISLFSIAFEAALVLAGIMGFAIQRGATCAVVAVEQIVVERRTERLQSLLLASAWVLSGLLLAHASGLTMSLPHGYALGVETLAGGMLLGLGAYVNQSCVFGSIAKFGSGQWSYLGTPVGYYLGSIAAGIESHSRQMPLPVQFSLSTTMSLLLSMPLLVILLWLTLRGSRAQDGRMSSLRAQHLRHLVSRRVWEPGAATGVIGLAFLGMWLLVGAWTYTDLLSDLAKGMPMDVVARSLLFLALLAGAIIGGWSAGRLHRKTLSPAQWMRNLGGGALMGLGSALIPGGNDGLLLVGMPLLWGYAWSAVAMMSLTIAIAIIVERRFKKGTVKKGTEGTSA